MISGSWNGKSVSSLITHKHISLLKQLFIQTLSNDDNEMEIIEFDPYVISTFKSFVACKKEIIINYYYLSDPQYAVNHAIVNLIMYRFSESQDFKVLRDDNDNSNLFKLQLLNLLRSVRSLTLITKDDWDFKHRSLSMDLLLSMIRMTSLQRVTILSYDPESRDNSWMTVLWEISSSLLIHKYKQANYQIQFKYNMGPNNRYHGFIVNKSL